MGNRVSIAFRNNNDVSPVLFSHWGGIEFVDEAKKYVRKLKKEAEKKSLEKFCASEPLYRLEPGTVMIDFIINCIKPNENGRVCSDYYLETDEKYGDNSDNGHFDIDL